MLELPKNFESYDEKRRNAFLALYEEKKKGKKVVGTFCSYTPTELIHAAGAIPVGLCGNSEQGILEAETRLPKALCPLIKSSYGLAMTDQCPFFYFSDGVLAETTCDGKKKMYELLGELKPVHVMKLPQGKDHALALESWAEEIRLGAKFLEELFDVKITEEKLHDAIVYRNRVRKALIELYEVAKAKPTPVSGYELTTISESASFRCRGAGVSGIASGCSLALSGVMRPRTLAGEWLPEPRRLSALPGRNIQARAQYAKAENLSPPAGFLLPDCGGPPLFQAVRGRAWTSPHAPGAPAGGTRTLFYCGFGLTSRSSASRARVCPAAR